MGETNKPRLLLASQSPRRRELLVLLGVPFEVTVADVAETPRPDEPPAALVVRLSQAKAHAAGERKQVWLFGISRGQGIGLPNLLGVRRIGMRLRKEPEQVRDSDASSTQAPKAPQVFAKLSAKPGFERALIIACDTIVALDGELLGKPRDATEATVMLRRLRGRSHAVYSAVTLLEPTTGRALTDVAETRVTMRAYTDAELAAYVASGDPLDKAGAYAIQHPGFHPVAGLRGCYANVVGLPLCHLTRSLRAWGIEPPHDVPAACQSHAGHHCPVYATILNDQW